MGASEPAMKERIKALPKWAQDYIEQLERKATANARLLEEAAEAKPAGDFYYTDVRAPFGMKFGLPQYANLFARLDREDVRLSVNNGMLEVFTCGLARMALWPMASNGIRIAPSP